MAYVDPVQVDSFFFQDADLLVAYPVRRPSVGRDGNSSLFVSQGRRPQDNLLGLGNAAPVRGDLDYPGLDSGAFDPFFYFPYLHLGNDAGRDFPEGTRHR